MTTNFKIFTALLIAFFIFTVQFGFLSASDRNLHVIISALLVLGFAIFTKSYSLAITLALVIGIGKELYDPVFDELDLIADCIGIAIGSSLLCAIKFG